MKYDNLCVNEEGDIVLLVKLWTKAVGVCYITVYGFTGFRQKRQHRLHRVQVHREHFTKETAINHAHLWAMREGVSDYIVHSNAKELYAKRRTLLLHPRMEYQNELRETNT